MVISFNTCLCWWSPLYYGANSPLIRWSPLYYGANSSLIRWSPRTGTACAWSSCLTTQSRRTDLPLSSSLTRYHTCCVSADSSRREKDSQQHTTVLQSACPDYRILLSSICNSQYRMGLGEVLALAGDVPGKKSCSKRHTPPPHHRRNASSPFYWGISQVRSSWLVFISKVAHSMRISSRRHVVILSL